MVYNGVHPAIRHMFKFVLRNFPSFHRIDTNTSDTPEIIDKQLNIRALNTRIEQKEASEMYRNGTEELYKIEIIF